MSKVCEITVNVDEALSVNKYEVDEETPHIELAEDDGSEAYNEEFLKLVRVCPAALYKVDGDGAKSFDYAGCLECGTCRIACEGTIVKKWVNPGPTMGVEYRLGYDCGLTYRPGNRGAWPTRGRRPCSGSSLSLRSGRLRDSSPAVWRGFRGSFAGNCMKGRLGGF